MIADNTILENLRAEWHTVEKIQQNIDYDYRWIQQFGTQLHPDYGDLAASLCLVFALSILEHALIQMRDEGLFVCPSNQLSRLMAASSNAGIPWIDFSFMNKIREQRNYIAHKNVRLPESESRKLVEAVGSQLAAWGIAKKST